MRFLTSLPDDFMSVQTNLFIKKYLNIYDFKILINLNLVIQSFNRKFRYRLIYRKIKNIKSFEQPCCVVIIIFIPHSKAT